MITNKITRVKKISPANKLDYEVITNHGPV